MSKNQAGSIQLENVSKSFNRSKGKNTYSTLKSSLLNLFSSKNPKEKILEGTSDESKFFALNDISIDIPAGSSLALVGRNGSGKSTILKLLAGIYTPDSGQVKVNGSVSALIELGAGFHPDFSGRENIYLGGIMFGLSKAEISKRFEKIVTYAELEHVIDQPVRTYSSGMYMRLGFSLAIHTDPDILLIDEVLAVGDAHFIHKCQDSISEFKHAGKTLIFVTHDLSSVSRWCDQAVWLENGKIKLKGSPRQITDSYLLSVSEQEDKMLASEDKRVLENSSENSERKSPGEPSDLDTKRWGNKTMELSDVVLSDGNGKATWTFSMEDSLTVSMKFTNVKSTKDIVFGIGIIRVDGLEIFGTNTGFLQTTNDQVKAEIVEKNAAQGIVKFHLPRVGLSEGTYFMDVACHAEDGTPYDYHHRMHKFQVRTNLRTHGIIEPVFSWSFN